MAIGGGELGLTISLTTDLVAGSTVATDGTYK